MVHGKARSGFRCLIVGQLLVLGLLAPSASAAIEVTEVSPGFGWNNATIIGNGLLVDGELEVILVRPGQPRITGTNITFDPISFSVIFLDFDLNGAKAGWLNLSLHHPFHGDASARPLPYRGPPWPGPGRPMR